MLPVCSVRAFLCFFRFLFYHRDRVQQPQSLNHRLKETENQKKIDNSDSSSDWFVFFDLMGFI